MTTCPATIHDRPAPQRVSTRTVTVKARPSRRRVGTSLSTPIPERRPEWTRGIHDIFPTLGLELNADQYPVNDTIIRRLVAELVEFDGRSHRWILRVVRAWLRGIRKHGIHGHDPRTPLAWREALPTAETQLAICRELAQIPETDHRCVAQMISRYGEYLKAGTSGATDSGQADDDGDDGLSVPLRYVRDDEFREGA